MRLSAGSCLGIYSNSLSYPYSQPSDCHARAVGISVRFPLLLQEKVSEAESSPAKGLSWMASDKLGPFQKYNQKTTTDTT